ncbi:MAG: hypothetical protein JXA99_08280 [Candidatus Lokiarchaeota archaeon]|nr:hypothetical protein [Candidatus Lokiarchaeota archaeon]
MKLFLIQLFLTGFLIIIVSILGPMFLNVIIYRTSDSNKFQVMGQDLWTLIGIAPLILISGIGFIYKKKFPKYFLVGTGTYQVYTYLSYILGAEYALYSGNNEFCFFIFIFLVITGYLNTIMGIKEIKKETISSLDPKKSKIIALIILILGIVFGFLWISEVIEVLITGDVINYPGMYKDAPNGYWTIRSFDLVWSIPIMFYSAYLLITRPKTCYNTVLIFMSFGSYYISAVLFMGIAEFVKGDPNASIGTFFLFIKISILVWSLYLWLLRQKKNI